MKLEEIFAKIYRTAQSCGYPIYAVGGYVRDKLLGKTVKDVDFVVVGDAMIFANQLQKDLRIRTIVRYPKFGTFMAQYYGYKLEFVNAREESYQRDSRNPDTRPADLLSDLSRRDFTINALAMDISPEKFGTITDIFHGQEDLRSGIIRTPRQPEQTFSDDPLRMMRAIRFAAQLGFTIEQETLAAIQAAASRLRIISQERITDEFNKILTTDEPSYGIDLLSQSRLLEIFFPEISDMRGIEQRQVFHHKDVYKHTLEVVDNVARSGGALQLRLAALLHDVGKPRTKKFIEGAGWTFYGHEVVGKRMAGKILQRFRYPAETIAFVQKLVELHLRPMALVDEGVTDSAVRRLLFNSGDDIDDLMRLCRADITSKNERKVKRYLANYDLVIKKIAEVEAKDRLRNFKPPVDGNEIMALFNVPPGPFVGRVKKFVEEAILDGRAPNEHDACLELIKKNKHLFLTDDRQSKDCL
jgi:tRNA adenylyltransferase